MPVTADRQARGLSVKQWTLVFFGAVVLCAIFFAVGYLVGSHGPKTVAGPAVEQVPPPSAVPAPINPPLEDTAAPSTSSPASRGATVIEQNLPARSAGQRASADGEPAGHAGVMIQVAALSTQSDAESLLKTLKAHGYHAVLVTPQEAGGRDNLYRIQIGPFGSRDQALKPLQKLSQQGFRPFIKE